MQLDFFRRLISPGSTPEAHVPPPAPSPAVTPPPARAVAEVAPPPGKIILDSRPLQERARTLLQTLGYGALAEQVLVRWNPRMRSTAGTANMGKNLILLNPGLHKFGDAEIDRTLLHELAHLLAHHRAGRRRIPPHGAEWQQACRDLGLPEETRCHDLPLPRRQVARRYLYRCPGCARELRRVRPLRRKAACTACCKAHNGGKYDARFCFVPAKSSGQS